MKKAVFTVNLGGYDVIKTVPKWEGWDSILFTDSGVDNPRFTKTFQVKSANPQMESRYYKWCSHITLADYDTVIYYDANLELIRKPSQDHFHIVHEVRKSVREEIDELIKLNHRWDRDSLERQWKFMVHWEFPDDHGLFLNGFFGRSNKDSAMNELCDNIWAMCQICTNRDMLALPYLLWLLRYELPNQVPRSFFSQHVKRPAHKGKHPLLTL